MTNDFLRKSKKDLQRFRKDAKKLKIALLCGPKSYEDKLYFDTFSFSEISSGFIYERLRAMKLNVVIVKNTAKNLEEKLRRFDVVFINMHGEYGEDGSIQGLLTYIGKPFTGSGIYGSALSIDKVRFKDFVKSLGYPTPPSLTFQKISIPMAKEIGKKLGFPFLFKVINGGSSIGMEKVDTTESIPGILKRINEAHIKKEYFAEKFIKGRDLTVAILDVPGETKLLSILEIKSNVDFYDEATKIRSQKGEHVVQYIVPARLSKDNWRMIEEMCLNIYKNAGCRGFARVDMVLDEKNIPYVLELNTIPGLQKDSNFLLCAVQAGLSADIVLLALLYNALHKNPYAFERTI